jgi:hypothetical protein
MRRFSFNIDADTKQGFFASNRGREGSDDIYELNEQTLIIEDCKQFVEGVVLILNCLKLCYGCDIRCEEC